MKLVLFDIDGTLLQTGGLGRRASKQALEEIFGTAGRLDEFYPGGKTQEAIFRDTLSDAGIDKEYYEAKREALYQRFLDFFVIGLEKGEHHIKPLPGALALLDALGSNRATILGLVTGNHHYTAGLKLAAAGIDPDRFLVGAYGEESAERSRLVPLARERAEEAAGRCFAGKSVVVIGDTTRDVLSAASIGAVSIALTSGTDNKEQLESVDPDYIFEGLCNLQQILDAIDGSEK